jgi:hypothetical protein
MPVDKVRCPKCNTVLRPTKPLTPGKAVKCPKCGASFTAPKDEEEVMDVLALQPEEPASKPSPTPKPPAHDDDEDEGPATYRFVDELEPAPVKRDRRDRYDDDDDYDDDYDDDEDDEVKEGADDKADISVVPDLTVKDPRGIAQELIIRPSNWLMLVTILDVVLTLLTMCYFLIPIFFALPPDTDKIQAAPPNPALSKETAKKGDTFNWWPESPLAKTANWLVVLLVFLFGGLYLAYDGAIISGCVKMQNLESYGWCIGACIMAMIPISMFCYLFRLLLGISCLITLKRADVVAGFNYRTE